MASDDILIIQHIWTRWSKASRGANASIARVRPPSGWPLPKMLPDARAICQELRCLEEEGFQLFETVGGVDTTADRRAFHGLDRLTWQPGDEGLELRFRHARGRGVFANRIPSQTIRLVLRRDQTIRIDWNARLPMSLSGHNRAVVYEQRCYLLQFGSAAAALAFGQTPPSKTVDLTRHIY